MVLLLAVSAAFLLPAVQQRVADRGAEWFNETYDSDLQLRRFRYVFPNRVNLQGLHLPDHRGDTLIYAGEFDFYFTGFGNNHLGSGGVRADSLHFYYRTHKGDERSNLDEFAALFASDTEKDLPPFGMDITRINIQNSRLHYRNYNCDSCSRYLLRDFRLRAQNFFLEGSELAVRVLDMGFDDAYGLSLEQLEVAFAYREDGIFAENLDLVTGRSQLAGDVRMRYEEPSALKNFLDEVQFDSKLQRAYVSSEDIQYFAPVFPDFGKFALSGNVQGPVNILELSDLELRLGDLTRLRGNLQLRDVSDVERLYINTPNIQVNTYPADIRWIAGLFTESALPEMVNQLGATQLTGAYRGYLNSFDANGILNTDLGDFDMALLLEHANDAQKIGYQGKVDVAQLDLAKLTGNSQLGKATANLKIAGRGLSLEGMDTRVNGRIQSLVFNQYRYRDMKVNGRLAKGRFDGLFDINDPNLQANFSGTASFQGDSSRYDFQARIPKADLASLGFAQDSVALISANVAIDFKGIDFDRWSGAISLHEMRYENSRNRHSFDSLEVVSQGLKSPKMLNIRSDVLTAQLRGDYTFSGLGRVFTHSFKKFTAQADTLEEGFAENFELKLRLLKPDILSDIFLRDLLVEPGTELQGSFTGSSGNLDLDLHSDGLRYRDEVVTNIDLSMGTDSNYAHMFLSLGRIGLSSGYNIDSVRFDNRLLRDTLRYGLDAILRDSIDSDLAISGFAFAQGPGQFMVGLDSSFFNIGRKDFVIPSGMQLEIDSGRYFVEGLEVNSGAEKIFINGALSDRKNEILRVEMQDFDLGFVNYFLASSDLRFDGKLRGDFFASELLSQPKFVTDLHLDSLILNNELIGNMDLTTDYSLRNDTIKMDAGLTLGELQTVSARGYYQADSTGGINMDVDFNRFRLAPLNPIVSVVARRLRGSLEGGVHIDGSVRDPSINGRLFLPQVAFTISFLETDYNLTDEPYIDITDDAIIFPNLQLRDTRYGTSGTLGGKVKHSGLSNFELDMSIETRELLVLNTKPSEEDAYYGTAFATGTIDLKGPPDQLRVSARVNTERNTNFSIPIGGATEVKRSGFVSFKEPREEGDTLEILKKAFDLDKGLGLDFDIEVDQDAEVNIILNESTGNRMRATGDGQIRLRLKPNSDMELYGTYTVASGEYNFNLEGLFNKRFKMQRGGTVTWSGDPFAARLDITAVYTTKADPAPFVGAGISSGPTETIVNLNIKGPLTDPEISFDIKTPRANSTVQAVLSNRLTSGEVMNQQVFSLLALNTFTPQSNFLGGGGGGFNEWDIIANQAAAFLNKFTGDYELSLNYQESSQQQEATQTAGTNGGELEVGVSKNFLDDRLTVRSAVGVPLNNNQNNIAGDFEISYDLTEDGRLRAKAFNRAVDNQFNIRFGQQQLYQQGVGLNFKVDFDKASSIWKRIMEGKARREERRRKAAQEEEEDPQNEDGENNGEEESYDEGPSQEEPPQ